MNTEIMTRPAEALLEGDMIDLSPALDNYCPDIIDSNDISEYEYATVEFIEFDAETNEWIVYTDQHNVGVPADFEFEIIPE